MHKLYTKRWLIIDLTLVTYFKVFPYLPKCNMDNVCLPTVVELKYNVQWM